MSASLIQNDFDFEKASKLLNVMIDPRSSDDGSPVVGQQWFNTTSKRVKGYDGTTVFSLMRLDGTDTYTGIITFNPASGSVPFAVDATKNGIVTNLNSDRVDGYHVAEAATVSTIAARDASGNITVATPTSDGHAATKAYVDSIAAGQDWKDSCLVATTANITLSGTQTIDGVAVTAGARVLVKNQTTPSENGLYTCAAGAWSRTSDADENAEVTSGLTTYIEQGTENAGAGYTLTTSGTIVVGTTGLIFTRTSGGSVYSAGNGMLKAGTTFHFAQAASYTIGALPYADGASTIGFISAVASGKVLKSNGENTVPIWAAVDLTADVTGTLPVGKGGTGTATQFTSGSVIFAGASGVYSQDNAGLFFDAANNLLGVNTVSPQATIHAQGNGRITGDLAVGADTAPVATVDAIGASGGSGQGGSDGLGGVRARYSTGFGASLDVWDGSSPRWGITRWNAHTPTVVIEGVYNVNQVRINHAILAASLASSSSDSVVTEASGVLQKRTINSGVWGTQTAGRLLVSNGSGVVTTDSGLIYDPGTGRTAFNRSAGVNSDAAVAIRIKDLATDANVTSNEHAILVEGQYGYDIATGVTDSGWRAGVVIYSHVDDSDFEGTLSKQYGIYVSHGHTASAVGSIITNSYGLFIDEKASGSSTVTNSWGIYQTGTNAKNYFAGDTAVGTTTPGPFSWANRSFTVATGTTNGFAALEALGNGTGGGALLLGNQSILRASIVGADGSHLIFSTNTSNTGSSLSEKMRITSDGKVGIGTTPGTTLDVVSDNANPIRLYRNGVNASLQTQNSVTSVYFGVNTSGNACIGHALDQTNAPFQLLSSGVVKLTTVNAGSSNEVLVHSSGSFIEKRTINSGAWGTLSAGKMVLTDTSGNLSIDTTAQWSPTTKTFCFGGTVDSSTRLLVRSLDPVITVNGTSYYKTVYANGSGHYNIATGVTDSGYRIAVDASAFVSDADFLGTLTDQYAVWARHGANVSGVGSTITNSYGVYIDSLTTANTTITNLWGLYQANSAARNYFAGNVGIGIGTPDGKLHVHSGSAGAFTPSITYDELIVEGSGDTGITVVAPDGSNAGISFAGPSSAGSNGAHIWYGHTGGLMTIGTNNSVGEVRFRSGLAAEAMRIDSSGNVGIGTTDIENWGGGSYKAIEFPNASIMYSSVGGIDTYYSSNAYYDGAWKYKKAAQASQMILGNTGDFLVRTATSGTIDTAITWTTPLIIKNNGNIGIGTTDVENWASSYRAIQFPYSAIMAGLSTRDIWFTSNYYFDGGDKYRSTAQAAIYAIGDTGTHIFRVAPSGTINTAITWTTALTVNNDGTLTAGVLNTGTGNSVLTEESGVIKKRTISSIVWGSDIIKKSGDGVAGTIAKWTNANTLVNSILTESGSTVTINGSLAITSTTLVDNLNADTVDGYEASALLDLANSTGDTDDISEGLTNLFYTDARARAAISSTDSAEIAYNNSTGVLGLGTEAGRVKSGTIGDGASTSLTFTHNLGTRDVIVQVFQTGTPYKTVFCGITRNTVNQVTLDFSTAPAAGSRTVVVTAANG